MACSLGTAISSSRSGGGRGFGFDGLRQARVELTQTIAKTNLELANVFHRHYPQRCPDLPVTAPGVVAQFILCRAPFALPVCSLRSARWTVPVRAAWPVTRPAALRRSAAAFGCGGWGRCGAFFGAAVRLEDGEINHREHDYRDDGDYDVPVVHRISPHSSPGELQRTPTASGAIQMCGRMWMRSRRGKMGLVYSIRSGRDDPRGCRAGSGESLAAWAGGIYRSCAGAECRLLAQTGPSLRCL